MKGFLLLIGAYLVYQYIHHPPSPAMQPPGGPGGGPLGVPVSNPGAGGVDSGSSSVWTGVTWINCSSPGANPTMCAQLQTHYN